MKKFLYLDTENRIFGLDILRFIAIIFVMINHAGRFFPEAYIKYYTSVIYDGVGIFFVLSGFLIGGFLLKQMEKAPFNFKELKEFWYKRWSRTLPNYYLYLIILLLIPFYSPVLEKIIPNFFFLQNMMTKPENNFFGWSWSLSVEEWFYLIIPIIIYIFINYFKVDYKRSFLVTVALIITAGIVLRMQNYWGGGI